MHRGSPAAVPRSLPCSVQPALSLLDLLLILGVEWRSGCCSTVFKTRNLTYLQRLPQQNLFSFSRVVRKDFARWNCLPVDWFQRLSMQDHTSPSDTPDAHFLQPDSYFLLYVHTFFISPAAHQSRWAMASLRYQHHHHIDCNAPGLLLAYPHFQWHPV